MIKDDWDGCLLVTLIPPVWELGLACTTVLFISMSALLLIM